MIVLYCPTCGSWKLSKRDNGYNIKCHECLDIFEYNEADFREVNTNEGFDTLCKIVGE